MSSPFWREDAEEESMELPARHLVIDLPVLRPEHERMAKVVGKVIGIALVHVVAGLIWSWRGLKWVARRYRAWRS